MALFSKFFKKENVQHGNNYQIKEFGRFLSCNKPYTVNKIFNTAQQLYKSEDYFGSFEKLLSFLENPSQKNIIKSVASDIIDFTLIQGSQKLSGSFDKDDFYVSCTIGKYKELNPALFRYLLAKNHNLQYSCFAVNHNEIILKAYSKTEESSPEKLFFLLKEIALTADIETEAFKKEFPYLERNNLAEKVQLYYDELKVKIKFLKKWITNCLEVTKESPDTDDVLKTYAILSLLYRIDFLLVPEGRVKLIVQKCISLFNHRGMSPANRTDSIKALLLEITSLSNDELADSFCRYKYTFGIVEATSHKVVYEFILKQLNQISSFYSRKYNNEQLKYFYEYIIGYVLYYYGVYPATKKLLLLIYRLLYPGFFDEINAGVGFFSPEDNQPDKIAIESYITNVIQLERKEYPYLSIELSNIEYNDKIAFMKTLLNEITFLNFSQPGL